jgi:hypothetical protein
MCIPVYWNNCIKQQQTITIDKFLIINKLFSTFNLYVLFFNMHKSKSNNRSVLILLWAQLNLGQFFVNSVTYMDMWFLFLDNLYELWIACLIPNLVV